MFRLHFFHVFPQVDIVIQTLVFHSNSLQCCASDTQTRPLSVQKSQAGVHYERLSVSSQAWAGRPGPLRPGPRAEGHGCWWPWRPRDHSKSLCSDSLQTNSISGTLTKFETWDIVLLIASAVRLSWLRVVELDGRIMIVVSAVWPWLGVRVGIRAEPPCSGSGPFKLTATVTLRPVAAPGPTGHVIALALQALRLGGRID